MTIGFAIHPKPHANDPALLDAVRGIPTPLISDNMSRVFGAGAGLRPMHDGTPLLGFAVTVKTRPGDNLMVHKVIDLSGPGDVIVVDAGGDLSNAIIGEIMLTLAAKRGAAGFVIDGAIRDVDAFEQADFPCYARGVTHRGPYKSGPGEINVPVAVDGMVVMPGDVVVGDADGVVAFDRADAAELLELVRKQEEREANALAAIAEGKVDSFYMGVGKAAS
jgi:RraA family protein